MLQYLFLVAATPAWAVISKEENRLLQKETRIGGARALVSYKKLPRVAGPGVTEILKAIFWLLKQPFYFLLLQPAKDVKDGFCRNFL
jgi:hypothetical protein